MANKASRSDGKIHIVSRHFVAKTIIVLIVVVLMYLAALYRTEADPISLIRGLGILWNMVFTDLLPPDWGYFSTSFKYLVETWNIALLSTTFAAIIALPLTFLASNNINKKPYYYRLVRTLLNFFRTIPDIILAIIVVAFMGMGSVSGIVALTIFSSGILAKMLSETTEGINQGPLDAIMASGGNKLQIIRYGVIPQILPYYASYTLYVLEMNVKASVVLGFIGAGGIGQLLNRNMKFFRYDRLSMILLVLFITITIIDFVSNKVRGYLE
ncbi:phosphonate ABC transporter, permease protein PhnE [Alkalibacterium sp. f15]|uniref:phosphonate ABC transporter, permease protein PhnE n=1 Tax=Alkalibacterium sp. f15 TaxID=3414029 RepID=UPI003BF780B0